MYKKILAQIYKRQYLNYKYKDILAQIYKRQYLNYKYARDEIRHYCSFYNEYGDCPERVGCLILCPFQTLRDRYKFVKEEFMMLQKNFEVRYF